MVVGYGLHYIPYFFIDRTLFLHHYLPALVFKILLCAAFIQHLASIVRLVNKNKIFIKCVHIVILLCLQEKTVVKIHVSFKSLHLDFECHVCI